MSLREMRLAADALPVANGEYLWQQLAGAWSDYTHMILAAPFIDAAYLGRLLAQYPAKRFALIYHTNLGFLSRARLAGVSTPPFMALEKHCRNFTLASNSAELSDAI